MKKSDIVGMIAYYTLTLLFGSTVGVLSLIIKENSDRIAYYEGKWNKGDIIRGGTAIALAILTDIIL